MKPFYPKPSKPFPKAPPPPPADAFEQIKAEPQKFAESVRQSLSPSSPSPEPTASPPPDLAVAQAADYRFTQRRIRELEEDIAAAAREREQQPPRTSRFSQEQSPEAASPEAPPAPIMPSSGHSKGPQGPAAAARKKATRAETRSRIAGA